MKQKIFSMNVKMISLQDISFIIFFSSVPFIALLSIFGILRNVLYILVSVLVWFPFILHLIRNKKIYIWDSLLLGFLIVLTFLVSLASYPEYSDLYRQFGWYKHFLSGTSGVVGFLLIRNFKSIQSLKIVLKISAILLFTYYIYKSFEVINLGYWVSYLDAPISNPNSSMSFGYGILFPSIVLIYFFFQEKKVIYLVLSLIGFFEIVFFGGRGPIILYFAFIFLYFVFYEMVSIRSKKHKIKYFLVFLFSLSLGLIISSNIDYGYLSNRFSSRVFLYLHENELLNDNGRSWIWGKSIQYIQDGGIFRGYGALSDRYYLNGYFSHNIFLELLMTYGIFFGLCLSLIVLFLFAKILIQKRNNEIKGIFLIFFVSGFLRLMVSNSIWLDTNFWIALGLSINFLTMSKSEKYYEKNQL